MKISSNRNNRPKNVLPVMILIGLIIGIGLSFSFYRMKTMIPDSRPTLENSGKQQILPDEIAATAQPTKILFQADSQKFAIIGELAPDFTLDDLNGNSVSLGDFRGKPVVINLWATWCKPCLYEMPGFESAYKKYEDKGLVVLGINLTARDTIEDVRPFIDKLSLTFPILLDETGNVSSGLYGMKGLPMSYFIDSNGILKRVQAGSMLPEKVDEYLADILPK